MYSRFTDRARKAMQLAHQEAVRLNHEYIGTEHILLGLVKEGAGVGANVLTNFDIDLHKIRLEVEKIVQSGPNAVVMGRLPLTPRAKKVIEYSIEEARNLNHNYVGTEHLLLGLLREREGVAAHALMNLLLNVEDVRRAVRGLLFEKVTFAGSSIAPEDLIVDHVKKLPPLPAVKSTGPDEPHFANCKNARRSCLWTPVDRVVSWGRRHDDLATFSAGVLMTLAGGLGAWCFGLEDVNDGALLAGASYTLAVGMAYWPHWDRRNQGGKT